MADPFINLNCVNCGAKLEVYDDMDRFACGCCGTEMLVQRRGGTVALRAVAEAIRKVQIGTDKTAAEPALARLDKELEQVKADYAKAQTVLATGPPGVACAVVLVALLLFIGISLTSQLPGFLAVCIIVTTGVAVWGYKRNREHKREWSQTLAEARSKILQMQKQIEENRTTVHG